MKYTTVLDRFGDCTIVVTLYYSVHMIGKRPLKIVKPSTNNKKKKKRKSRKRKKPTPKAATPDVKTNTTPTTPTQPMPTMAMT